MPKMNVWLPRSVEPARSAQTCSAPPAQRRAVDLPGLSSVSDKSPAPISTIPHTASSNHVHHAIHFPRFVRHPAGRVPRHILSVQSVRNLTNENLLCRRALSTPPPDLPPRSQIIAAS